MALLRDARSHPTLEGLASSAGIHTGLVERLIESGLVEPVEWAGARPLFDLCVIPRLRCDLGINLAGIADILEMIERLRAVQYENDLLRSRL
jgi:MerR HTH family regulatory protein